MNLKDNFTEEDRGKVVKFLNMVAKHAEFSLKTNDLIEYFKMLSFMQQSLIPKIDKHILEVKRVIESEAKEENIDVTAS